jgi:hypothetical protein
MELPREERQALYFSACGADDLAALTAEVLPDEEFTEQLISETPPPVIPKYEKRD